MKQNNGYLCASQNSLEWLPESYRDFCKMGQITYPRSMRESEMFMRDLAGLNNQPMTQQETYSLQDEFVPNSMPWGLPSPGAGATFGGLVGSSLGYLGAGSLASVIGTGVGYLFLDAPNHHQRGEEFKRDVMRALDEGYNPLD